MRIRAIPFHCRPSPSNGMPTAALSCALPGVPAMIRSASSQNLTQNWADCDRRRRLSLSALGWPRHAFCTHPHQRIHPFPPQKVVPFGPHCPTVIPFARLLGIPGVTCLPLAPSTCFASATNPGFSHLHLPIENGIPSSGPTHWNALPVGLCTPSAGPRTAPNCWLAAPMVIFFMHKLLRSWEGMATGSDFCLL